MSPAVAASSLQRLFSEARVRQLGVFWGVLVIAGIFISDSARVLPSIGVAGLFLTSVMYAVVHQCVAQRGHWREVLSFTLIYWLHLATGLRQVGPADAALQQDLVLQLPFVLLPVAFLLLPNWLAGHKRILWLVLVACCLVAAAEATANYLGNYQEINQLYLQSKVMPTTPDHIRFSLLVSMAVLAGAVLAALGRLPARLRQVLLGLVLLLFLFQHLLAVRSGLVTMYAALALWLGWLGGQLGRWKAALAGAVLVAALGGACLLLLPTLQNKITNTRVDSEQIQTVGAANNYSVTARVYSYAVAWSVIRQHPVAGVSKVKLEAAMARQYGAQFPEIGPEHYLLPHNQFIFNLAAYGIIGLLVFLAGFYYPLWKGIRQRNILLLVMYLIVTISFTVEYTLETQVGVLTGLFFILLAAAPTASPRRTAPGPL